MPLSEKGRQLRDRLLVQGMEAAQKRWELRRTEVLRSVPRSANSMAPAALLADTSEEQIKEAGKVVLDAVLRAFDDESAEITDDDAKEIKRRVGEAVGASTNGAIEQFRQRSFLFDSAVQQGYSIRFHSAQLRAISELGNELEIWRLRRGMQKTHTTSPSPAAPDTHDKLTGLYDRAVFERDYATHTAAARNEKPLAFVITDMDHFKRVNDELGHPVGDRALQVVARCHATVADGKGRAYRLGGDEFVLILPNLTRAEVTPLVERLRTSVAALSISEIPWAITISVGVEVDHSPEASPLDLYTRADAALRAAKAEGKNRVGLAWDTTSRAPEEG